MTDKRDYLLPSGLSNLSQQVRVVAQDGSQIGVLTVMEATRRAAAENAELVMLAPQAKPPVCRIVSRAKLRQLRSK